MYAGFITVAIQTMYSTINIYYVAINFIYVPLVLAVQLVLLLQVFLSVQYHLFFPLYPFLREDPAPAKQTMQSHHSSLHGRYNATCIVTELQYMYVL